MADVVLDASAGAEILADTDIGTSLAGLLPAPTLFWVPDGVFDVEVGAVLRRWDLRNSLPVETISTARNLLAQICRRRVVSSLVLGASAAGELVTRSRSVIV